MENKEEEKWDAFVKKVKDFKKYCMPCYVFIKDDKAKETKLNPKIMYKATDIRIIEDDSYFKLFSEKRYLPCKYFNIVEYIYPN